MASHFLVINHASTGARPVVSSNEISYCFSSSDENPTLMSILQLIMASVAPSIRIRINFKQRKEFNMEAYLRKKQEEFETILIPLRTQTSFARYQSFLYDKLYQDSEAFQAALAVSQPVKLILVISRAG